MRKTMMVAAATLMASFGAAAAAAADLGGYGGSTKDGPVAYGPAASWAGLYVGASVGYAWGEGDQFSEGRFETDLDGAVYGAQVGYNFQRDNIVFGVEASFNRADMDGDILSGGDVVSTEVDWYATAVARVGYSFGDMLVYGFGGVAWGDVTVGFSRFESEESHVGWTAGLGVERALSDHLSVRLEYAHVDLGTEDHFRDAGCDVCEGSAEFDVVKVGVNYKFGSRHEELK
jgi:outer membrane immunogenic protein